MRRRSLAKPEREQEAKVAAREMRARDAALAMKEYHAERIAVRLRTARLRALRLAKESGAAGKKSEEPTRKHP
jgi:hypothetical protein